ncbi:MAG: nuclear transport factor 2 family protein [Pseudomonadaceae bacterium]|nr:nuclear transport factor 2 family protein [Pseudomonadaceae bacterium]
MAAAFALDPHQSWLPLEAAAAQESDARKAGLLTEVRNHMEAEIHGRLDDLMATLTAEPVYHFWGRGDATLLSGAEAVRGFYSAMFASGGEQFEVVIDRVIASSDHVVTEGQVRIVHRGADVLAAGVSEVAGEAVTENSLYVSNAQLVTVWPADEDGKLIGEDIYFGEDPLTKLVPIDKAQLPPYFRL